MVHACVLMSTMQTRIIALFQLPGNKTGKGNRDVQHSSIPTSRNKMVKNPGTLPMAQSSLPLETRQDSLRKSWCSAISGGSAVDDVMLCSDMVVRACVRVCVCGVCVCV